MAIAFSQQGTGQVAAAQTAPVTVTVAAGVTVLVFVTDTNNSTFTVTDDAAGTSNTYTRITGVNNTPAIQVFSTAVNAARAATTVTATTAAANERISVAVVTYTGVAALGVSTTNTGNSVTPLATITSQDSSNFLVAGFGWFNAAANAAVAASGNLRANAAGSLTLNGVAAVDNTAALIAPITDSVTLGTGTTWPAVAVELRTGTLNQYNNNPIIVNKVLSTGWRSNQTLYATGSSRGIRPQKVVWTGRTASSTNTFSIQDPNDSTVLLQGSSVDGTNPGDLQYDFELVGAAWRDFKVPTLSSGILLIFYNSKV